MKRNQYGEEGWRSKEMVEDPCLVVCLVDVSCIYPSFGVKSKFPGDDNQETTWEWKPNFYLKTWS